MTLLELDEYCRTFLNFELYAKDPSKNGIQVENSNVSQKSIKKIAFAVDACLETIESAVNNKADVLFVHHGLFWGHEQTLTGSHFKRIKKLIDNDIALYACHIPLDANKLVGNNYGLASMLCLQNLEEFGLWNGMSIGTKGKLLEKNSFESIKEKLLALGIKPTVMLPFGRKSIQTIAISSGGSEDLLEEAIEKDVDLFISGEISHESYHFAKEHTINVLAGGHYATETIGVSLVSEKVQKEKGLETFFIDVPTGL